MFASARRHTVIISGLVFMSVLGAAGCSGGDKPRSEAKSSADIFSDRPIAAVPDVYVVTLDAPPLLVAGRKNGHKWTIPDTDKQKLLTEQAAFEKHLSDIAPDAKIVYRYRMVLNALAVYATEDVINQLRALPAVRAVTAARRMARPEADTVAAPAAKVEDVTSVSFIGADIAHQKGFTGRGMRIGILDTGIDYTHRMLGGSGAKDAYAAVDPARPNSAFPNRKVVGGTDLVGTDFDASSPFSFRHLPKPDANPLDEAGHGTHVAGTVAGLGDGVFTYSGVAPDAELYAVKVFGKEGSTMDASVMAGFEYAADPNGDLNPDDQLDVVNLSLGGGFGQPQILYTEAVRNLTEAGTVVVASAGNSGPIDYVVGAPSTADDALSVAASVDGSPHNWRFTAVRFISPSNPNWLAKATEGPVSKPIAEIGPTEGELVDIGLADKDLDEATKQKLHGAVALIRRGGNPFLEKLGRAFAAGAIGAVVYNNDSGNPIPMGGDGKVDIPAIMVSQALGLKLQEEMKLGPVRVQFKTGELIDQPELIDSITEFSSKGPRSEDNLLKPEIAAPGARVISAAMGQGDGSVEMDGTSMAAPHMTGAMALLKQAYPALSVKNLKSLAMNTAKVLTGKDGNELPLTLQGAGRIQLAEALTTPVVVEPAALSLGRVQLETVSRVNRTLTIRNLKPEALTLSVEAKASPGLMLIAPATVTVPAGGSVEIPVTAQIGLQSANSLVSELDGHLVLKQNGKTVAQVPALAIRSLASEIRAEGEPAALKITNSSPVDGLAMAFNLLGADARKAPSERASDSWKSRSCDLQSAGYRILTLTTPQGPKQVLQFAVKLYTPVTTWQMCEVSVLIDQNGDGIADQELAGVSAASIAGISDVAYSSVLLDAARARSIRLAYEQDIASGKSVKPDYKPAMLARGRMAPFPQSSVALIEVPLEALATAADGGLHIKLATLGADDGMIEADDYLGEGTLGDWMTIPTRAEAQPYYGMPEMTPVGRDGAGLQLQRGSADGRLVLYYPLNELSLNGADTQEQVF